MTDQAQTKNSEAAAPAVERTFFTVEIAGGSPELAAGACRVIELAIETAIAMVRVTGNGKKNMPKLILHRPGTVQS